MPIADLPERGVVEVTGEDRGTFLQGLVSNDIAQARPGTPLAQAVWAALLTPQGKWLAEFFVVPQGEALLLDAEASLVPGLIGKLSRFRLRSRASLRDASADFVVQAGWGGSEPPSGGVAFADPRLAAAGWRRLRPAAAPAGDASPEDYDRHRLSLGLPDGSRDLEAEKSVLLEAGFDELHGVSWTKGCYMGQELTARTKYRGLVKRRLVPVAVEGRLPPRGTPVLRDGVEVGEMRSGRDSRGIALLRIDAARSGALLCGEARLYPDPAAWMQLPAPAEA